LCQPFVYCCKAVGVAIDSCCDGITKLCCAPDRPNPIFLIFTALMSAPVIILSIIGALDADADCDNPLLIYLVVAILLSLTNIVFSVYVFNVIKMDSESSVCDQGYQIFCYDPCVAVYICVYTFVFVWGCIGVAWSSDDMCSGSTRASSTEHSGGLLLAFTILTPFVMAFSLCWARCQQKNPVQLGQHANPQQQQQGPAYPPQQQGHIQPPPPLVHGQPAPPPAYGQPANAVGQQAPQAPPQQRQSLVGAAAGALFGAMFTTQNQPQQQQVTVTVTQQQPQQRL